MVKPIVSIIMGSDSDMPTMNQAAEVFKEFGVPYEITIVSAHRTPKRLVDFSENAHKNGIQVIIAGAGGAAHLPGMVAAISPLPVIGVPIKSSNSVDGWDSILSSNARWSSSSHCGFEWSKKCWFACRTDSFSGG